MPSPVRDELAAGLIQRIDYASSTINYYGSAAPGTGQGEAAWRIKRETLDSEGRTTAIEFAQHSTSTRPTDDFVHRWDDRASLSYS